MNKLEKIRKQSVTKQKRPKKRSLTFIGEGRVERGTSGIDQMRRGKHSDQDIADNDKLDSSGSVIHKGDYLIVSYEDIISLYWLRFGGGRR